MRTTDLLAWAINAEPVALEMWLAISSLFIFHVAVFEVFEEYTPSKYILHAQIKSRFQMVSAKTARLHVTRVHKRPIIVR